MGSAALLWLAFHLAPLPQGAEPAPTAGSRAQDRIEVLEERYADGTLKLRREVRRDKDGVVNHGLFESWHPNGQLARKGRAVDGRWDGLVVEYWINGRPKDESEYKLGVRHGKHNAWWLEGPPKRLENYKDGKLHGKYEDFRFGPTSHKFAEGAYVEGQQDGPWKEFYPEGVVASAGTYKLGLKHGLWIYHSREGKKTSEESYADGALDGVSREFAPSGALLSEAHYKAGKSEGLRIEWYESGGKKSETHYVGGLPNGRSTAWFEDGKKRSEGELVEGKRTGPWTYWNPDGTVNASFSGRYQDDKRVGD